MSRFVIFMIVLGWVFAAPAAHAADAPPFVAESAGEGDFHLVDGDVLADVYVDADDHAVVGIAARLFAEDVERVTGRRPAVKHDAAALGGSAVVIGTLGHSELIDRLAEEGRINVEAVRGQWETFVIQTVDGPFPEVPGLAGVDQALVIAGSDRRGTAFGVFEVSEQIGVSPWYWWADVTPERRDTLVIKAGTYRVGPPSVKYRGIFINDEDWGLQPWAAKTFDPEFGDIGPKTYEKVFELLLRLKGNHLWPAMHGCTVEFGAVDRNVTLAHEWAIVMGAAHCEPLNRNNVWWKQDGEGEWRYDTNRANMLRYWEEWAEKRGDYEAVWTVGMRGIHDRPLPGDHSLEDQVTLVERAIHDQRQLLGRHVNRGAEPVPQVFTPYKEALTHYQAGLDLPDDVTILWCEDNYGYIRQLSTPEEQARSGGAGVYYHISYLGWPRPYLWLNTTPPALMWQEMTKAYDYGADRVWVLNVGDIKPGEIGIEFWQRLAWDIDRYGPDAQRVFLREWAGREFGAGVADEIATILDEYYQLGFQRKPELMEDDVFSVAHYREAARRLEAYRSLVARAESLDAQLPREKRDAFYQLVLYPVRIATWITEAFVSADESRLHAKQRRITANRGNRAVDEAVWRIESETAYYNDELAGGKWRRMMPVKGIGGDWNVQWPTAARTQPTDEPRMGVALEGQGVPLMDRAVREATQGAIVDLAATEGRGERGWRRQVDGDIEHLVVPNGAGNTLTAGEGPKVTYDVTVPETGRYHLFMLINCPTNADDSWFLRIDDGEWMTWNDIGTRSAWDWRRQGEHHLTKGRHTLTIAQREDGAMFSRIRFTQQPSPLRLEEMFPQATPDTLPPLDPEIHPRRYLDVYNTSARPFTFEAETSVDWLRLSETSGEVDDERRLWVEVDWDRAPRGEPTTGEIALRGAGAELVVKVPVDPRTATASTPFVETDGYISIEAEHFTRRRAGDDGAAWTVIGSLGRTGDAVAVLPATAASRAGVESIVSGAPVMEYDLTADSAGEVEVRTYCLPTHRIHEGRGLRYAIAIDDEAPTIVDFYESGGHAGENSPQWRTNVSRNAAENVTRHTLAAPGPHTLKVWMVDPGVVIDKLVVDTGGLKPSELGPPETHRASFEAGEQEASQ